MELAAILGIRQSSISDAKRRRSIPGEWFLTIWKKTGISPEWLEKGSGSKYLTPSNDGEETNFTEPNCRKCFSKDKFAEAISLINNCIQIDTEFANSCKNAYVFWLENGSLVNVFTFPNRNSEPN